MKRRPKRGSSLPRRRWRSRGLRVIERSGLFVFSPFLLFLFLSVALLADMGGRRSESPARIDHFDPGRDSTKGGKIVAAAAMALRAGM